MELTVDVIDGVLTALLGPAGIAIEAVFGDLVAPMGDYTISGNAHKLGAAPTLRDALRGISDAAPTQPDATEVRRDPTPTCDSVPRPTQCGN